MEGVFPQVVFRIGGIPVRDTVISTWVMMALIIALVAILRRLFPDTLQTLVKTLRDMISGMMGRPTASYLPFLGTLAIFIAVANVLGALPSIPIPAFLIPGSTEGRMIPVVSPTHDVNVPIALAIIVLFAVHYFGIKEKGGWTYFKDLISPIFLAPLTIPLEVLSELSRTLSLSVRLFGNIISTDLIVAVIFSLVSWIAPLPFVGFSFFTGLLQAYIFTTLSAIYIAGAVESSEVDV